MTNCVETIEVMYAIWHAGLCAVPMNAKLHAKEFAFILENSGAKLCFVTPDLAETIAEAAKEAPELKEIVDVTTRSYSFMEVGDPVAMTEAEATDPAWLFYTSGTTGRPKGATLTHRNLLAMTLNYFADVDRPPPGGSIVHAAPISHGSGLWNFAMLARGSVQVFPESGKYEVPETVELMNRWPECSIFLAPTMVKRLIEHGSVSDLRPDALRLITYGGAPMYVSDLKRALDLLGNKLSQLYGQGESPMTITHLSREMHADRDHPRWEQRLASAGRPDSCVAVKVVDEEGRPLPVGEVGEIIVKGDTVMSGYWNNPEATARSLRDGWLWTGDVGAFDEEGLLTLKDRSKDMIISGGSNIYPREIEDVLNLHPAVAECSVVGRPHPEWGEEVVAFVVPRDGKALHARRARPALPRQHRALQAAEGLQVRRRPAQEQLRQDSQDGAAQAALEQVHQGGNTMGSMIDFKRPDGSTCKGYLAEAGNGKPGIVVLQEWWGLNDQIKGVADRFAAAGYNALAPDLYKGRVTQKPDEANHMMSGLDFVGASDQDIAGAVKHLAGTEPQGRRHGLLHGRRAHHRGGGARAGRGLRRAVLRRAARRARRSGQDQDPHAGPFRQQGRLVHARGGERVREEDGGGWQQARHLPLRRPARLRQREEPGLRCALGQGVVGTHDGVLGQAPLIDSRTAGVPPAHEP